MPFIDSKITVPVKPEMKEELKSELGGAIKLIAKTENWLMLRFVGDETMYFGGSDAPCLMADVCVFGKQSKESYAKMTAAVTELLSAECAVPADRIYVKYTEYDKWGWNGGNF